MTGTKMVNLDCTMIVVADILVQSFRLDMTGTDQFGWILVSTLSAASVLIAVGIF